MPHDITSLKCHSRLKFHGLNTSLFLVQSHHMAWNNLYDGFMVVFLAASGPLPISPYDRVVHTFC